MKLYRARLQAKLAKYKFEVSKIKFLEYVIRRKEVLTDPKKTQVVQD